MLSSGGRVNRGELVFSPLGIRLPVKHAFQIFWNSRSLGDSSSSLHHTSGSAIHNRFALVSCKSGFMAPYGFSFL